LVKNKLLQTWQNLVSEQREELG